MILIVTNRQDQTADYLILEFQKRGVDYFRFNTEDFPQKININWKFNDQNIEGSIESTRRRIQFEEIFSVWYRRPVSPIITKFKDRTSRDFVVTESNSFLEGLWRTLDCFWVSNPDNIRKAENKLYQLKQAKEVGFQLPHTIITNDPAFAREFYKINNHDIVYKPLRKGRVGKSNRPRVIFTNPIDEAAAKQLNNVDYSPSLFQKYVRKKFELRVTVIGDNAFAASIHSQQTPSAKHDWRRGLSDGVKHRPFCLPDEISTKCTQLVKRIGLEFGAIDLILTPEDQFIFLEINPNGQWAWVQQICPELPLREEMADLLINGK